MKILLFLFTVCLPLGMQAQVDAGRLQQLQDQLKRLELGDWREFAPGLHHVAIQTIAQIEMEFKKGGKIREEDWIKGQTNLDQFKKSAKQLKAALSRVYLKRQSAIQASFVREYDPLLFNKAEIHYQQSLDAGARNQWDSVSIYARKAQEYYHRLVKGARKKMKKDTKASLRAYRKAINKDIKTINTTGLNPEDIIAADVVVFRTKPPVSSFNQPGGVYVAPFPDPLPGPNPSQVPGIFDRQDNAITIAWYDGSDNETGNRVLRSTDLLNWQSVAEVGTINKLSQHTYQDQNLQADTRYCYQIETYNAEGARLSPFRCTYTLNGHGIGVWRLQLQVKVANITDAGIDNPLRIIVGDNGESIGTETLLDYGRDDFEKNSTFTYDLNLTNITDVSDITNLMVINYGTEQDAIYIEELVFLVNEHEFFHRIFGNTSNSALKLTLGGVYKVAFEELRSDASWQAYINSSLDNEVYNLPKIEAIGTGTPSLGFRIENAQLVSRVEGLIGHMLNADGVLKERLKWGHIFGATVEVSRKSNHALHIDLDLEGIVPYWPNPEMDIDFDIEITKNCEVKNGRNILIMELASKNFTSNADYSDWADVASLGILKLADVAIDWYAQNCTDPPVINQALEVPLPDNINCDDIEVYINEYGDLVICCFGF